MSERSDPAGGRSWLPQAIVGAVLSLVVGVATVAIVKALDLEDEKKSTAGPTTGRGETPQGIGATPSGPEASAEAVEHRILHQGPLEMRDGKGWELDVKPGAMSWVMSSWESGTDLGYTSWDKSIDEDAIHSHGNLANMASLPKGAKGTREECVAAKYGNEAFGERILVGRMVCVLTTEDRYALLRIVAKDSKKLIVTAEVTLWE